MPQCKMGLRTGKDVVWRVFSAYIAHMPPCIHTALICSQIFNPSLWQKPDIKPNEKAERSVFNEVFQKQLDFTPEPDRRIFLERLFLFMEERGNAITQNPTISKQPIDLYKLYCLVKERGGMVDVSAATSWLFSYLVCLCVSVCVCVGYGW